MINPAVLLAQAKAKKKVSRKQLHRAAQLMGASGGNKRALNLKAKQRTKIASYAAKVRWGLDKKKIPFAKYSM